MGLTARDIGDIMTQFTKAEYRKELVKLRKQAEALRPAAQALGLERSLNRMHAAIVDTIVDTAVDGGER